MTVHLQTLHALIHGLSGVFHIVPQLDHPMLLSGPDILVGGEGKLTAIFCIEKKSSEKQLLARITATRLAMPSNTRLFAQISADAEIPLEILGNFDETASKARDSKQLVRYCNSEARPKIDRAALAESKRLHSEKYAFALMLALLRRKHELSTIRPELVIKELSIRDTDISRQTMRMPFLRKPSIQINGAYVASLNSLRNSLQQLRTLCDSGLNSSYQLVTGVPYVNQNANLNILLVEKCPIVRHDPDKPLRSAAFGCWIMAKSSSAEDISLLIERSRDPKHMRRWRNA